VQILKKVLPQSRPSCGTGMSVPVPLVSYVFSIYSLLVRYYPIVGR
jgi:hypothetical protein